MLHLILKAYRQSEGLSVRAMAGQIGIDHATLWRFEEGKEIRTRQWVAILHWTLTGATLTKQKEKILCRSVN